MIPDDLEAEILRLHHAEKWPPGTVAAQLGVHHDVVDRVIDQEGIVQPSHPLRQSMVDPYLPFMKEQLEKYPKLKASRLFEMVKLRGYPGAADHFRSIVAQHRPKPFAEAYLRLRTLPGEQAQVDWGHFGKIAIGKALRPLMAFVMVLSWSRQVFLRFYLNAGMSSFIHGHVEAFAYFQGVGRTLLYDNLKSAVLERVGDAIRFNPTLLELAKYYRFAPRPVAPARGNQKGRVERKIRDIRDSFFAAREYRDVADLNEQALSWCQGIAADRKCPEDPSKTVREAFEEERPRLMALPDNPFAAHERFEVRIGKTPYARFDLNDYSVPHTHVRRTLVVVAAMDTVRIIEGNRTIASHPRSWSRREQIEDPSHIETLVEVKRAGREHRGIDRLRHAAPNSQALFAQVAERGGNLGGLTSGLLYLLDAHGAEAMGDAIGEALAQGTPHLSGIRQILERRCIERGKPPALPVHLPDDPRIRDMVVRPHSLKNYDQLGKEDDDGKASTEE